MHAYFVCLASQGHKALCDVRNMLEPRVHALSDSPLLSINSGASIGVESNFANELLHLDQNRRRGNLQDFEQTKDFVNSLCHQPPPMLANPTDLSQSCAALSIEQELATEAMQQHPSVPSSRASLLAGTWVY